MILGALAISVLGIALLVRRRRATSEMTLASGLFTALARDTSANRSDWPRAMLAEHDAIEDRHERDRFAKGAILALAMTRPGLGGASRRFEALVDSVFIGSAMALAAVSLVRYPGLRVGTPWVLETVLFLFGLACYGALALTVSRFGTGRDHLVGALVGAPVFAIGWAAGGWATGAAASGFAVLLASCVVLVPVLAVGIDLIVAGPRATAWVAGVTCAVTTGLSFFVGFVGATLATNGGRPSPGLLSEAVRSGIHPYSAWAVGDALGGASFMLVYVLVVGGFIGLGLGALTRSRAVASDA